jgi:hypothetical protein
MGGALNRQPCLPLCQVIQHPGLLLLPEAEHPQDEQDQDHSGQRQGKAVSICEPARIHDSISEN